MSTVPSVECVVFDQNRRTSEALKVRVRAVPRNSLSTGRSTGRAVDSEEQQATGGSCWMRWALSRPQRAAVRACIRLSVKMLGPPDLAVGKAHRGSVYSCVLRGVFTFT